MFVLFLSYDAINYNYERSGPGEKNIPYLVPTMHSKYIIISYELTL